MTAPADSSTGDTNSTTPATGEDALGDPGKAALAAERKRANAAEKAARDAAAELQALRDKDATASEVATRKAAEADTRANALQARLDRIEVAAEKGLPSEWAARLTGSTRDELAADADALLKLLPKNDPAPPAPKLPGRPAEKLRGGGDPSGALPLNGDPIVDALRAKLGISG